MWNFFSYAIKNYLKVIVLQNESIRKWQVLKLTEFINKKLESDTWKTSTTRKLMARRDDSRLLKTINYIIFFIFIGIPRVSFQSAALILALFIPVGMAQAWKVSSNDYLTDFLMELPRYLINDGFNEMYLMSSHILLPLAYCICPLILYSQIKLFKQINREIPFLIKVKSLERQNNKNLANLNQARSEVQSLQLEVGNQDDVQTDLLTELEAAETRLQYIEADYLTEINRSEELEKELRQENRHMSLAGALHELELTRNELLKIKKLWTHDYNWMERLEIEREMSPEGTSPFIRNVGFVGFESFIKKRSTQKLHYSYQEIKTNDELTIKTLIDELADNEMISKKDKNLFHEVRIARNSWLHDAKPPSNDLLERLLKKLEVSDPVTKPIL